LQKFLSLDELNLVSFLNSCLRPKTIFNWFVPSFEWFLMGGKLIVIEGTDGSGKATQSKRLLEHFEKSGISSAYYDFPRYDQKSAGLVENYLNGKYGSASEVGPKVASIFYAADRYDASFELRKQLSEGKIVLCNRYVSASMGHQAGKISNPVEREEFLRWLEDLEYGLFGIPKPDLVILLYVPYLIAQKLVDGKGYRPYVGGSKRDIHEADSEHLRNAEEAYLEVAKKKGWRIINCTKDEKILPVEEIHEMVWKEVKKVLAE
jgi:dTMP kinase